MATLATSLEPDFSRYEKLREKRSRSLPLASPLPVGWPKRVDDKSAWYGQTLGEKYVVQLTSLEKEELYAESKRYMASQQSLSSIDTSSFSLPHLSKTLEQARIDLHEGTGMVALRGLDPTRLNRRENVIAFAGISSYIAEKRGRQAGGKLLIHIKDLSKLAPGIARVAPYTNKDLPFHTDLGDVVSMYVLETSKNGGEGTFASVSTIYNELACTRPDLLEILSRDDWPFEWPFVRPGQKPELDLRPLMTMKNGKPTMNFTRGALLSQQRSELPPLNEAQAEALDCIHYLACEYACRMAYQQGDFVAFNNRYLLHGRERFEDGDEDGARHFLRLWLRDTKMAGSAPTGLEQRWNAVFQDFPDDNESRDWPLEPNPAPQAATQAQNRK